MWPFEVSIEKGTFVYSMMEC